MLLEVWVPGPHLLGRPCLDCLGCLQGLAEKPLAGTNGLSCKRGGWQGPHQIHGSESSVLCISGKPMWAEGKDIGLEVWKRPEKFFNSMLVIYFCYYELIFFF